MAVFYKVAANPISFGLYASLGFVPVECWMDLEGNVTTEEASSANRSCGFSPVTGSLNIIAVLQLQFKCVDPSNRILDMISPKVRHFNG